MMLGVAFLPITRPVKNASSLEACNAPLNRIRNAASGVEESAVTQLYAT